MATLIEARITQNQNNHDQEYKIPQEKERTFPWEREGRIGDIFIKVAGAGIPEERNFAGFSHAFVFPRHVEIHSPEVQDFHVNMMATLMEQAMDARSWDGVDIIYLSSVTATDDVAEKVAEELKRRGKHVGQALFYNQACYGGFGPLIDLVKEHADDHLKIIGGPCDTLSGDMISPEEPKTALTFGNGYGVIAATTDEIEVIGGRTTVYKDTTVIDAVHNVLGAIRMPEFYAWDTRGSLLPPPHYHFQNGAFEIYHRTEKGSKIRQYSTNTNQMAMDGSETLHLFKEHATTPLYDPIAELYEYLELTPDDIAEPLWHQPSNPVRMTLEYAAFFRALQRKGIENIDINTFRKTPWDERMKFVENHFNGNAPYILHLPWVMDQPNVKLNNVSGVTSLMMTLEMIDQGRVKLDTYTPILGLGIGIIVGSHLVKFHKQS